MSVKKKNRKQILKEGKEPENYGENIGKKNFYKNSLLFGLWLCLVIVSLFAFWNLKEAKFLDMDDHIYVYENETIKKGITFENIKWAFSTVSLGFYFPVTIISHLLDVEMYDLNSGDHHITSILIHLLSVTFLFLFLIKGTKNIFCSFFVTALFGFHPLHVESVAWISERKDVLSAMFFFLTLLLYLFYVDKGGLKRYLIVFLSFLLGMLSKPMVITLPFVLLLIDYWPLQRFDIFPSKGDLKERFFKPIYEKIPFFALVPLFAYISYFAQKSVQAVAPLNAVPLKTRILNSFISYVQYIRKVFYPDDLALFYPFPKDGISFPYALISLVVLLILFLIVLFYGKKRKYLFTGFFWYSGVLVPVIGLVQIGSQAMADRYSYISAAGIFIAVVFVIYDLVKDRMVFKKVAFVSGLISLCIFFVLTKKQAELWTDSKLIYEHSINVTKDNYLMHYNLGGLLFKEGETEKAIYHFKKALEAKSYLGDVYLHLGYAYGKLGRIDDAINSLRNALKYLPRSYEAHLNLGKAYETRGEIEMAIKEYEEAVQLKPTDEVALTNLGILIAKKGDLQKAIDLFKEAIKNKPGYIDAHNSLGVAYLMGQKYDLAVNSFQKALEIDKGSQFAIDNLAKAEKMLKLQKEKNERK